MAGESSVQAAPGAAVIKTAAGLAGKKGKDMRTRTFMMTGAAAIALAAGALLAPVAMADPIPQAASYADLLEPVPDAMARIHADDALGSGDARFIPAQINIGIGIGHHHHHHHSARWYRDHGFFWNGRVWVQGPPPPPVFWHNHHADWYRAHGYYWDGHVWAMRHHHHHHHHHWR